MRWERLVTGVAVVGWLVAACGSREAIEPADFYDPSGAGGTSGVGPGAVNASSASVAAVTNAASSGVSSSSGGPILCDGTGSCQDCIACSISGPCADQVGECQANVQCAEFSACIDGCMGPGCFQECAQDFPQGAQLYRAMRVCLVCEACASDCADQAPPQLCNG